MDVIATLFCTVTIWTDLAYRKVPNAVLIATLVAVGVALSIGHFPEPVVASRLTGFAIGLLVMLPVYALGRMGAGDVKFFAIAGLFAGPAGLVTVWVVGSLLAFAHALFVRTQLGAIWVVWRNHVVGLLQRRAGGIALASVEQMSGERGIPYAAYLAIGLIAWMVRGA